MVESSDPQVREIPLAHWLPAHYLFDWCSRCPGRDELEEANAWRAWAQINVPGVAAAGALSYAGKPVPAPDPDPDGTLYRRLIAGCLRRAATGLSAEVLRARVVGAWRSAYPETLDPQLFAATGTIVMRPGREFDQAAYYKAVQAQLDAGVVAVHDGHPPMYVHVTRPGATRE